MTTSAERIRHLERKKQVSEQYINELKTAPLSRLLTLSTHGALSYCMSDGYGHNHFLFRAQVHGSVIEYSIHIVHPDDRTFMYCVQHTQDSGQGRIMHYVPYQSGKWDKHLEDAIEYIRKEEIAYHQRILKETEQSIVYLNESLANEKRAFEDLFE